MNPFWAVCVCVSDGCYYIGVSAVIQYSVANSEFVLLLSYIMIMIILFVLVSLLSTFSVGVFLC